MADDTDEPIITLGENLKAVIMQPEWFYELEHDEIMGAILALTAYFIASHPDMETRFVWISVFLGSLSLEVRRNVVEFTRDQGFLYGPAAEQKPH